MLCDLLAISASPVPPAASTTAAVLAIPATAAPAPAPELPVAPNLPAFLTAGPLVCPPAVTPCIGTPLMLALLILTTLALISCLDSVPPIVFFIEVPIALEPSSNASEDNSPPPKSSRIPPIKEKTVSRILVKPSMTLLMNGKISKNMSRKVFPYLKIVIIKLPILEPNASTSARFS